MPTTAIILAAGRSTRMKSRRAKPLHEVCGRPMLAYTLSACYEAGCNRVLVVVGHGRDSVVAQFEDGRITWVEQPQQMGTGDAVKVCNSHLKNTRGDVLIMSVDRPLVRGDMLKTLLQAHQQEKAAASMATAVLDNPAGFTRVLRGQNGEFESLVEETESRAQQLHEVFAGHYCIKVSELCTALDKLTLRARKREYNLADIYAIIRSGGKKVVAAQVATPEDLLNVNTRQQLAEIDAVMQERIHRAHRDRGVTIVNSYNTYIEAGSEIGPDTVIYPFTFIGRDSSIGSNCTIGPFARVPRDSVIPEATTVMGHPAQDAGMRI